MVADDRRIWRGESNGDYSVKSAYLICVNELIDTSHLHITGDWNLIWGLQTPPKVKNFIWCICRRCVPTRAQLRDKGVDCPQTCVLCNDDEEDNMHIFFNCASSRNVWSMTTFSQIILDDVTNNNEAHLAIFQILRQLAKEEKAVFACILWSIWKQMNKRIWNNIIDAQNFIFSRATNMLQDWKSVRTAGAKPRQGQTLVARTSWCKPMAGKIKCNIDASFPTGSNKVGIGICIRDDQGAFILAKTEWFTPQCEVHIGETLG